MGIITELIYKRESVLRPIDFIQIFFQVYTIMLFIRIFSSWIPEANGYRIIRFVSFYTDPYLQLFRRVIPPLGMFDISPIIAFIALRILEQFLIYLVGALF